MTRTGKEIKVAFIRFEKFGDRGRHKQLREKKKRIKEKEYRKKNATPFQGKCLSSLALWCRIVQVATTTFCVCVCFFRVNVFACVCEHQCDLWRTIDSLAVTSGVVECVRHNVARPRYKLGRWATVVVGVFLLSASYEQGLGTLVIWNRLLAHFLLLRFVGYH